MFCALILRYCGYLLKRINYGRLIFRNILYVLRRTKKLSNDIEVCSFQEFDVCTRRHATVGAEGRGS